MVWLEILGLGIGYLFLGIPALRLMYMMTEQNDVVKDFAVLFFVMWPGGLAIFGLNAIAQLAFKWDTKDGH